MLRTSTSRAAVALCALLLAVTCFAAAARSSSGLPSIALGHRDTGAAAAGVIYRDNFSADRPGTPMPAGWEMEGGRWTGVVVDSGHVLAHAAGPSYGQVVTGSPAWTNYTVGADVKPTADPTGFAGVIGRYQTEGDYYECVIHHAMGVQLWRLHGGQGMELGGRDMSIDVSRYHRVVLAMHGDRLTCSMDGTIAASVADPTFSAGRIGLVASDDEAARFGDVLVTK
jgi:pectate lyase